VGSGIYVEDGPQYNEIGGGGVGEGNVITANAMGVVMAGSGVSYNTISGNLIGLDVS